MREHIARLEMRVKELENPEQSAPSMTLFDPHALSPYYSESSSSSSYDSPGKLSYSASASPTPFPMGEQDPRRSMLSPLTLSPSDVDPRTWEHLNFESVSSRAIADLTLSSWLSGFGFRFRCQLVQWHGGTAS